MVDSRINKMINNLEVKQGIFWSIIWFFIVFLVDKRSINKALISGIYFFIIWVFVSLLLLGLCEFDIFCI